MGWLEWGGDNEGAGTYRNVSVHARRIGQHRFVATRTEYAQTERVRIRFEHMQLLGLRCERVYLDDALEHHYDAVAAQPNGLHRRVEVQRKCRRLVEIVPDDDLGLWIEGPYAAADQRQIVAAEQHLDVAEAALGEDVPLLLLQRVHIVDPESVVGGTGKATFKLAREQSETNV